MDASQATANAAEEFWATAMRFYFRNRHTGDKSWQQYARERFRNAAGLRRRERNRKRSRVAA